MFAGPALGSTRRDIASIIAAFLAAGVSLWLSSASLQIPTWRQQEASRIALFAPLSLLWWSLVVSASLAAAVIFAGRHSADRLAARAHVMRPLLALWLWAIPYLPWLPDQVPLLVLLAGPVRFIIAGVAMFAVAIRVVRVRARRGVSLWRLPGRATVAVLSFVLYAALGLRSYTVPGLIGDEPHYLVIAHSLLFDHDLQIENNHKQRDYRDFYHGELPPDSIRRGQNGEIYPNKAPGLPALLVPAYRVAGAPGAIVTIALLAALAALAIFDVALLFGGRPIAWAAWAGTCLTVPVIPHAWSIFPDMAAAVIAAWSVRWLTTSPPKPVGKWVMRGACLALLPWLHTKFVVLLAMLTLCMIVRFRARTRESVALLVPVMASTAAWFMFFRVIYGTFDPRAPWGGASNPSFSIANVPRGVLGLLFDQKFGLLVYTPFYGVALAGAVWLARDRRWRATAGMLIATSVAYTVSCARFYIWWGGTSPPARFLVPLVPLVAPLVAAALDRGRSVASRATIWSSLVFSLLIAVTSMVQLDRRLLYSDPHGTSDLVRLAQGAVPLTSALPIFTEGDWPAPVATLLPWLGAALASVVVVRTLARRRHISVFWSGTVLGLTFLVAAAVLVGRVSREGRAEAVTRSRLVLLEAFNPSQQIAFDYAHLARLAPHDWLGAATLVFDGQPGAPVDPTGLVGPPMPLPPGRYEATIWFRGGQRHEGALQMTLGRGQILARADGPLSNPARLVFELAVRVPALWIQLSEPSSAQQVLRAELAALSVLPVAERPRIDVRAVETIASRLGSYVVYVGDGTFAERGGSFWTRGLARGTVLVKPAGARQLVLNLSPGPHAQTVHVRVGTESRRVTIEPSEHPSLAFEVAPDAAWVPIDIQASATFRPVDVDRESFDNRVLGCRVQIDLR